MAQETITSFVSPVREATLLILQPIPVWLFVVMGYSLPNNNVTMEIQWMGMAVTVTAKYKPISPATSLQPLTLHSVSSLNYPSILSISLKIQAKTREPWIFSLLLQVS